MANPKISIKFEATGAKGLKKTIDDLHVANTRLTKGQKAAIEAQKDAILTEEKAKQAIKESTQAKEMARKQARAINAENRNSLQTQHDLQKLKEKEIRTTIQGRDARRSARVEMQKENAERKKTLSALKADIIARSKQNKKIEEQEIRTRNLHGTFSVARSKLLLFSFGVTLALDPIRRLVKASSDANEVLNKSSVVFGENMDSVRDWAGSLGDAVGRATSTLLEMASGLQDLFVPMGFSRARAAELSTSLTELAIDVASFSNKIDLDVMQDFESALVGNHRSVRKYGVLITEATIKQEAYNLGITDTNRELTESEKVQARVSLLFKGSADAMGDAQRTADEYAQSLVRFNETWKEISENVGSALKPILAFGLGVAGDTKKLTSYALVLGALGLGYGLNSRSSKIATKDNAFFGKGVVDTANKTKKATFITRAFSKVLRRVPYLGMFLLASELIAKIFELTGAFENQNKTLENSKDIIEKNADATKGFVGDNEVAEAQLKKTEKQLQSLINKEEDRSKALGEYKQNIEAAKNDFIDAINMQIKLDTEYESLTRDRIDSIKQLSDEELRLANILEGKIGINNQVEKSEKRLDRQYEMAFGTSRQEDKDNLDDLLNIQKAGSSLVDNIKTQFLDSFKNLQNTKGVNKAVVNEAFKFLETQSKTGLGVLKVDQEILNLKQQILDADFDHAFYKNNEMKEEMQAEERKKKNAEDQIKRLQRLRSKSIEIVKQFQGDINKYQFGFEFFSQGFSGAELDELGIRDAMGDGEHFLGSNIVSDRINQALANNLLPLGVPDYFEAREGSPFMRADVRSPLNFLPFEDPGGAANFLQNVFGAEIDKDILDELMRRTGVDPTEGFTGEEQISLFLKGFIDLNEEIEETSNRFDKLEESIKKAAREAVILAKVDPIGDALGQGLGQLEFDFLDTFDNMKAAFEESNEIFKDEGLAMKDAYMQMGADLAVGLVNMQTQAIQAEMNSIKEAGEQRKKELKESRRFQKLSEKQQNEQLENIDKATSAAVAKQFEKQQDMARIGVILDTASAIMRAVREFPITGGMPFAAIAAAMGAAQLAVINQQKPPKAQAGGLVGGRRHSQGGTIIEAEEGEFIVNRDAVSSVGVETMNRINRGGGASQVSVSFTGNVMSDDFIENEAIPKIKEAVRRGSDIGVS